MILVLAPILGLTTGLVLARWHRQIYQPPEFRHLWLVFAAFLLQFTAVYQKITRELFSDWMTIVLLLASQTTLLGFAFLNRRHAGMFILLCGVVLNLAVMIFNGGFMPISPQTASRLVSEESLLDIQTGSRIGAKDILLHPEDTRFEWLADRFLPPVWFPYQVAFSLGDIFIAFGVLWLLARPQSLIAQKRRAQPEKNLHIKQRDIHMTAPAICPRTLMAETSPGLSRVFAAAVVNRQFCSLLLRDPASALRSGYQGQTFSLSSEEQKLLLSIRAITLSDLARQINLSLLQHPIMETGNPYLQRGIEIDV